MLKKRKKKEEKEREPTQRAKLLAKYDSFPRETKSYILSRIKEVKNYPAAWTFPMIVEKHSDSEIQGLTNRVNVLNRKKTLQTRFHALDGHLKYLIRCTMSERGNALDVNFSKTVNNSNSKELESLELYLDRIIDNVRLMRTRHNDTVRYIQESSFSRVQKMLALENSKEVSEVFDRIAFMGSDNEAICFAILGKHLNAPAAEEQRLFNKLWDVKKDTLLSIEKEIDSMYEQRLLKSNIFSWFFAYVMPGIRKILQPMLTRLEKKVIQQKWDSSRSLSVKANVKFTLKDLYSYIAEISLNAIYTAIYNLLHNEYNFQNFIFRLQMMLPVIKRAVQFLWNKLSFHVLFGSGEFLLMRTSWYLTVFMTYILMGAIAGLTFLYTTVEAMVATLGQALARVASDTVAAEVAAEKLRLKASLCDKYAQLGERLKDHIRVIMREIIGSHNTSLTFEQLLDRIPMNNWPIIRDLLTDRYLKETVWQKQFDSLDGHLQRYVLVDMRNMVGSRNVNATFQEILESFNDVQIASLGEYLMTTVNKIQQRRMRHDIVTSSLQETLSPAFWSHNYVDLREIYDRTAMIPEEYRSVFSDIFGRHIGLQKDPLGDEKILDFHLRRAKKKILENIKKDLDYKYLDSATWG